MIRCRFKSQSSRAGYRVHVAKPYWRDWQTLCLRPVDDDTVDWLHASEGEAQPVNCQRCIRDLKFQAEHIMTLLRGTS